MLETVTLERMYGPEVGRFFQDTLTAHGVKCTGHRSWSASRAATGCARW